MNSPFYPLIYELKECSFESIAAQGFQEIECADEKIWEYVCLLPV